FGCELTAKGSRGIGGIFVLYRLDENKSQVICPGRHSTGQDNHDENVQGSSKSLRGMGVKSLELPNKFAFTTS
ncbi:MAG: hypothetical protein PHC51_06995, partial [bacterium]|nr:hypothetical protein [bacterium]